MSLGIQNEDFFSVSVLFYGVQVIAYIMQRYSVGFILDLKCGAGKKDAFVKIGIGDLSICLDDLLQIRSKIGSFADVVDLCPKHNWKFIDNYPHEHQYKCFDSFSIHKQLVKMNLHEVMRPKFHSMFSTCIVLPRQQVCMKIF